MKRFLSLLLVMLMLAGAMSVVSIAEPEEMDELPEDAIPLDYAGYIHDSYFVILAGDFLTVAELTELGIGEAKDMNYFAIAVVDEYDCIIEINTTLGRPAGVKSETVCPEGGYIIGLNGAKEGYTVLFDAKVGDYIDLYNVDVEEIRGKEGNTPLVNAGFTISRINEESSAPEDSQEESVADTSSEDTPLEESPAEDSDSEEPSVSETSEMEESVEEPTSEEPTSQDPVNSDGPTIKEPSASVSSDSSSDAPADDGGSVMTWVIVIVVAAVVAVVIVVLLKKKKQ